MRYLRNESTDPYFNMAFDEYALEQLTLDEPIFYLWQNRPAVIIGVNQDVYAEVNLDYLRDNSIALVRRVTGGGAVYHDLGNLNYTIVGRSADLNRDYPEYTQYMLHALQTLGVEAELSGRNDILVNGRKVSGYAKRVYKDRLMVHGSLMYDVNLSILENALNPPAEKLKVKGVSSVRSRVDNLNKYLRDVADITDFRIHLERFLSRGYRDVEIRLSEKQLREISFVARTKFSTDEWNYRRLVEKKEGVPLIVRKARLACGMIEARLHVSDGIIVACHFGGDFIGGLLPSGLEDTLVGRRYEREVLWECLKEVDVQLYFDGLHPEDLLKLIC